MILYITILYKNVKANTLWFNRYLFKYEHKYFECIGYECTKIVLKHTCKLQRTNINVYVQIIMSDSEQL